MEWAAHTAARVDLRRALELRMAAVLARALRQVGVAAGTHSLRWFSFSTRSFLSRSMARFQKCPCFRSSDRRFA